MRYNLWKQKLIFTWVLLPLLGMIYSIYLLKPPVEDWCSVSGYLPANRPTASVHALKVVVKPWLGQHHIYGVFMLSAEKCRPGQPVILTVRNAGNYCENSGPEGPFQNFEGIEAPSGYYLTRHYIRTRTALWLSIQGLFNQLRLPRNWTLTYAIEH